MTTSAFLQKVWLLTQKKQARYFDKHLNDVGEVQRQLLAQYLKRNTGTVWGRKYGFASIRDYDEYVEKVPVIEDFSTLQPYILQMEKGQKDVLFGEKLLFFESTSGSTGNAKLIPYNSILKEEFGRAVAVWMTDLYHHRPEAFQGKSYWSLSPALKSTSLTSGGIRVGIASDAAYFDPLTAWLLDKIWVMPASMANIRDPHEFYVQTWRHLLTQRKALSLMSVWSPVFLLNLHAFLNKHKKEIFSGLQVHVGEEKKIKTILDEESPWDLLFPSLALVSCWTQAQSQVWLPELREILGAVSIQGKGLLSTEGVVTVPYDYDKHILAYTSHFFEFRSIGSREIYLADDLVPGMEYEVILTTGAGLYRYLTHDRVQCTGYLGQAPFLEFVGRGKTVSDLVGEKIYEQSLTALFYRLVAEGKARALYLYPVRSAGVPGYRLLIEGGVAPNVLVAEVEQVLLDNPYYAQARRVGQLASLHPMQMEAGFTAQLYRWYGEQRGMKDGDIKLPLLFELGFLDDLLSI